MSTLESIIAEGNRGHCHKDNNHIRCADGFDMSVIAGGGSYCKPRPTFCWTLPSVGHESWDPMPGEVACDYPGPYVSVEVGYPSERPEPWDEWSWYCGDAEDPTGTVYCRVPVDMVRRLVASHGGEVQ